MLLPPPLMLQHCCSATSDALLFESNAQSRLCQSCLEQTGIWKVVVTTTVLSPPRDPETVPGDEWFVGRRRSSARNDGQLIARADSLSPQASYTGVRSAATMRSLTPLAASRASQRYAWNAFDVQRPHLCTRALSL